MNPPLFHCLFCTCSVVGIDLELDSIPAGQVGQMSMSEQPDEQLLPDHKPTSSSTSMICLRSSGFVVKRVLAESGPFLSAIVVFVWMLATTPSFASLTLFLLVLSAVLLVSRLLRRDSLLFGFSGR